MKKQVAIVKNLMVYKSCLHYKWKDSFPHERQMRVYRLSAAMTQFANKSPL